MRVNKMNDDVEFLEYMLNNCKDVQQKEQLLEKLFKGEEQSESKK